MQADSVNTFRDGVETDGPLKERSDFSESPAHSIRPPEDTRVSEQNFAVLVIRIGKRVTALAPIRLSDPEGATKEQKMSGYLIIDEPLRRRLEETAVRAFESHDAQNRHAWARIDIRSSDSSCDTLLISGITAPVIFTRRGSPIDETLLLAREAFAGAELSLLDLLVSTKRHRPDTRTVAVAYDEMAPVFDSVITTQETYHDMYKHYIRNFSFSGTILDLACGTGMFARCLRDAGIKSYTITGVDISPASIALAQPHYTNPCVLADLWTQIMSTPPKSYDHITCFGAMHFFDAADFTALLARMLICAVCSVSFEVDDLSQEYLDRILAAEGPDWQNFNNLGALRDFGVPKGWKKVLERRVSLYKSPATGIEVECIQIRFERCGEFGSMKESGLAVW